MTRGAGHATRRLGSDQTPRLLHWGALVLLVPLTVLLVEILSAGILPFPLLGILLVLIIGRLVGRDG